MLCEGGPRAASLCGAKLKEDDTFITSLGMTSELSFDDLLGALRAERTAVDAQLGQLQKKLNQQGVHDLYVAPTRPEGHNKLLNGSKTCLGKTPPVRIGSPSPILGRLDPGEPLTPHLEMPAVPKQLFAAVRVPAERVQSPLPPVSILSPDLKDDSSQYSMFDPRTSLALGASTTDVPVQPEGSKEPAEKLASAPGVAQKGSDHRKSHPSSRDARNAFQGSIMGMEKSFSRKKAATMRQAILTGEATAEFFCPTPRELRQMELEAQDEPESLHARLKGHTQRLLRWNGFESFIATVVFLDFILLGLDAQERLHPETMEGILGTVATTTDTLCKLIYIIELGLRIYGFGFRWCIQRMLIRMDMFLVACSTLDLILLTFLASFSFDLLSRLTVIRVLRLARVARLARLTFQLRTLWLLISGLAHSAMTIFWTFVLISCITYVFAVLGMELIPPADLSTDTEYKMVATTYFGYMSDAMLTLLQVLTLDSIAGVYRPLIRHADTPDKAIFCAVYFISYILFVSIALMNLVTAVMVEGSLAQAASDKEYLDKLQERQNAQLLPEIRAMFEEMDDDDSNEITLPELMAAPDSLKERLTRLTGAENPADIFHLLDEDDSGTLMIDEFMQVGSCTLPTLRKRDLSQDDIDDADHHHHHHGPDEGMTT
eukprot:TRINITY_DN36385_c0_g2_i5.p1 TRINITY_DN36385_c0_g2~~TRINITY_DN36385_c0_g2_i5.p1  ORF type:complete len:659 (+),score=106.73 TRINITY_DN36385_c0_g2_i5:58-2034(+)